ncbi:MAG: Coenzyme F420 hydrogenase/dehydrogenase, beta subunit C-terminal domain [Candidatus Bathyarchaeota archaeon]|nr:Coenzyme F420 hydrogenase/dehydrogenase, beta subunit C-terminal domain [Candidatus Bathyarchaeota archaeon]
MSFNKVSFEETLGKSVVASGKCVGCGTCVVVCPFNCLEYKKGNPSLVKECKVCGICAGACPQYEWSWPEAENFVFGRERKVTEQFGVYRQLVVAKARRNEVLEVCQDGGVATGLLLFALEEGLIDSAIVSGISQEKPFYPVPKLATTPEEILECSGTRYSYSPNILALAEGIKQKRANMAFVGTPCQIRAIRKIQMLGLKKYAKPFQFLIGLMCSECFTYEGLMEKHVREKLGLSLNDIEKMNIKGKILVKTKSEVKTIPLAEAKQHARKSCRFCDDFSSELADISTGGLGLDGWTFTIIRTEKGEELFSKAEKAGFLDVKAVDKDAYALNLLTKLSKKKRKPPKDLPK